MSSLVDLHVDALSSTCAPRSAFATGSVAAPLAPGLKRHLLIDVTLLAAFHTLDLLFGGANGMRISVWSLAFSMVLFLALALAKRVELRHFALDVPQVSSLAGTSACVSTLYTNTIAGLGRLPIVIAAT